MRRALLCLVVLFALCIPETRAQGCSQCRDTVSQTNPAVQRSYREGIVILLTGAVGIAGVSAFVMRRFGR